MARGGNRSKASNRHARGETQRMKTDKFGSEFASKGRNNQIQTKRTNSRIYNGPFKALFDCDPFIRNDEVFQFLAIAEKSCSWAFDCRKNVAKMTDCGIHVGWVISTLRVSLIRALFTIFPDKRNALYKTVRAYLKLSSPNLHNRAHVMLMLAEMGFNIYTKSFVDLYVVVRADDEIKRRRVVFADYVLDAYCYDKDKQIDLAWVLEVFMQTDKRRRLFIKKVMNYKTADASLIGMPYPYKHFVDGIRASHCVSQSWYPTAFRYNLPETQVAIRSLLRVWGAQRYHYQEVAPRAHTPGAPGAPPPPDGTLVRELRSRAPSPPGDSPCAGSACVPLSPPGDPRAPGVLGGTRAQLAHQGARARRARTRSAHQAQEDLGALPLEILYLVMGYVGSPGWPLVRPVKRSYSSWY
jgi:hypothetical protein